MQHIQFSSVHEKQKNDAQFNYLIRIEPELDVLLMTLTRLM